MYSSPAERAECEEISHALALEICWAAEQSQYPSVYGHVENEVFEFGRPQVKIRHALPCAVTVSLEIRRHSQNLLGFPVQQA